MGKRGPKTDKTGRTQSGDKFAKVFLVTMQSPAWRALSPYAQRLHPWLLLDTGERVFGRHPLRGSRIGGKGTRP
jgi:hypothetical protein